MVQKLSFPPKTPQDQEVKEQARTARTPRRSSIQIQQQQKEEKNMLPELAWL